MCPCSGSFKETVSGKTALKLAFQWARAFKTPVTLRLFRLSSRSSEWTKQKSPILLYNIRIFDKYKDTLRSACLSQRGGVNVDPSGSLRAVVSRQTRPSGRHQNKKHGDA
jgi:hypothetical protein